MIIREIRNKNTFNAYLQTTHSYKNIMGNSNSDYLTIFTNKMLDSENVEILVILNKNKMSMLFYNKYNGVVLSEVYSKSPEQLTVNTYMRRGIEIFKSKEDLYRHLIIDAKANQEKSDNLLDIQRKVGIKINENKLISVFLLTKEFLLVLFFDVTFEVKHIELFNMV